MGYFGGGGVAGTLHPSLQAYVDCFCSPPFPKMFPRGGGIWEQDPILVRDFRLIRTFELQWKETREQQGRIQDELSQGIPEQGGEQDLEGILNDMLDERGLGDDQFF